jgi:hypothetical protein
VWRFFHREARQTNPSIERNQRGHGEPNHFDDGEQDLIACFKESTRALVTDFAVRCVTRRLGPCGTRHLLLVLLTWRRKRRRPHAEHVLRPWHQFQCRRLTSALKPFTMLRPLRKHSVEQQSAMRFSPRKGFEYDAGGVCACALIDSQSTNWGVAWNDDILGPNWESIGCETSWRKVFETSAVVLVCKDTRNDIWAETFFSKPRAVQFWQRTIVGSQLHHGMASL